MSEKVDVLVPPMLRVVSAEPRSAVAELNSLLGDYQVMSYHWAVVRDELILSALLVHNSVMRKMQLADLNMGGRQ